MTITMTTNNGNTGHRDLKNARRKVEDLILDFIQNDGSKGRLMYELAVSCWGAHRSKYSSSNAVKQRNPFNDYRENFMSVVDLPSEVIKGKRCFHGEFLLKAHVLGQIKKQSGCTIKICGDDFNIPVELCNPYVLVYGGSFKDVDRAVEIIKDYTSKHQQYCPCTL